MISWFRSSTALAVALLSSGASSSCSRTPPETSNAGDASPSAAAAAASSAPVTTPAASASGPTTGPADSIVLGPLPPDAPFQGRLTVHILAPTATDPDGVGATYRFLVKGAKARWDLFSSLGKGPATGLRVYDGDQRKFFTVMTQHVVYVTDAAKLAGDAGAPSAWKLVPFTDTPTSRIQDVPCDRVHTEDARYEYDMCLAKGVAVLPLQLLGAEMASIVPFGAQLEEKRLFPLTILIRGLKAAPGSGFRSIGGKLTVEAAERGSVSDEAFALPNYPVQDAATLAISTHLLH